MSYNGGTNRRRFLKGSAGIAAAGIAGCIGGGGGEDTVRIGAPVPTSGSLALFGQINQQGYEFARERLDGEILGGEFELVVRDTQTEPSTGVQVTRELVEDDNVDALVGVTSSAVGINVIDYIQRDGQVPWIASQVSTLAARENPDFCNRFSFYPWPSFRQMVIANDQFIVDDLPDQVDGSVDVDQVYIVAMDFEAGQSARDVITEAVEARGGSVEGVTMVPMTVDDWSTYFPDVENAESDIVTGFIPGEQAISFINQAAEFGIIDQKTLALLGDTTSPIALAAVGDAANGMFSTHWYDPNRETPLNQEFIQWMDENDDVNLPPNEAHASAFNQLYSLGLAMDEAGSTETDAVIDALEGLTFDSPMGELSYRESDHQTRLNFIGDVVEGGSLTTLTQYPDVIGEAFCSV